MTLLVITLINTSFALAPVIKEFVVLIPEVILSTHMPQDVLQAMILVESGTLGSEAYNKNEPQAKGILQIWPCMVKDVNRILGYEKYTLEDRLDDKKAIEMFWVYQIYYNPEMNTDKMARIWCGGPDGHLQDCTLPYLKLVKSKLASS